jgi:hypothetical protein
MPRYIFVARSTRKGTGVLPPNPKQWNVENHALDLREELGIPLDAPLNHEDAFRLLPNVTVLAHGVIPAAAVYLDRLRQPGRAAWSGMAFPVGDGHQFVVYNDAHSIERIRATLMEEYFHIRLGHPRSQLRLLSGKDGHRTYNRNVEQEAYDCGAAALVPYRPLKAMFDGGRSITAIASHFAVSGDLVTFRAKVTRCLRKQPGKR